MRGFEGESSKIGSAIGEVQVNGNQVVRDWDEI